MSTDIGEYLVGARLQFVEQCDFVNYNVRTPNGGLDGLHELDILGINLRTNVAYLCEVKTHICGLQCGRNNNETLSRIRAKFEWQRAFAEQYMPTFTTILLFTINSGHLLYLREDSQMVWRKCRKKSFLRLS